MLKLLLQTLLLLSKTSFLRCIANFLKRKGFCDDGFSPVVVASLNMAKVYETLSGSSGGWATLAEAILSQFFGSSLLQPELNKNTFYALNDFIFVLSCQSFVRARRLDWLTGLIVSGCFGIDDERKKRKEEKCFHNNFLFIFSRRRPSVAHCRKILKAKRLLFWYWLTNLINVLSTICKELSLTPKQMIR